MGLFEDRGEVHQLRRIADELEELICLLRRFMVHPATGGTINQIGGSMPTNLSIVAGTSGIFMVTWNGALQPGAPVVWSASDPAVVLAPVTTDPTGNTESAAVPASDTASTFVLTATATNLAGAPVTATATITITPAPPAPATAGVINQLS